MTIIFMTGCGDGRKIVLTTGFLENEIFRIDSDSCYEYEAMVYLVNTKNQYKHLYGEEFLSVSVDGVSVNDNIGQTVLSELSRVKCMNLLAVNYQISLDDSDMELINKAATEYYNSLTADERKVLNVNSSSDIAKLYEEYRIAEKVYEFIVKDINPEISDDEARTMVVKEIFISSKNLKDSELRQKRKLADEALGHLIDGEEFDSIAAIYSDNDQINKSYTKMSIDSGISEKAFALSKGELSDVLEGQNGYYILLCIDPFSRDETYSTKELIVNDRKLSAFENVYDKYVDDRKFYINQESLDKILNEDISKTDTSSFFEVYYSYFK